MTPMIPHMKITRQTMRADGLTVGQAMDRDAALLRSLGIPAKDGALTFDEQRDEFQDEVRSAVLKALDGVLEAHGKTEKGWTDADLPTLFRALDKHAETLFDRHLMP